jgi:1-deoxy-D-xylulose-5-phosphate synthase
MDENEKTINISKLNLPSDLKKLSVDECNSLCEEIRKILISTISKNGGHLASNLGAVEITVALHRVFDSPQDKFIWDVGHQCYTHKILTGRLDRFDTIRTEGGLSGFPKPEESEHDIFISGHSSTSISVACGVSEAMKLNNDREHYVVAIIGDGALTGGLAYEGLNNAGKTRRNMIVILNDNAMSISRNVGALSKYLRTIRTREKYVKAKQHVEKRLLKIPKIGKHLARTIKNLKDSLKSIFMNKNITLFENLGFVYLGPIDGHDIQSLEQAMKAAKTYHCPVLIHVNTTKGKGYAPAEENPGEYHGVSKFDIMTGNPEVAESDSYSTIFGKYLVELAEKDNNICAITAAMKYGTGLQYFAKRFPMRFYDVGIAEEHAITFAGGLASQGKIPVFAVYSSFLQRSFDQLIHDISIGNLHMVLCIDRSGIVGQDGETHQGMFDIALLTSVPGATIYAPSSYKELKICMIQALYKDNGLACIRYPKGNEEYIANDSSDNDDTFEEFTLISKNPNSKILIISYGRIMKNISIAVSQLAVDNISCDILKISKIFPLDNEIFSIAKKYDHILFFEESYQYSGIGNIFASKLVEQTENTNIDYQHISADKFLKQGSVPSIIDKIGMSVEKIELTIKKVVDNGEN